MECALTAGQTTVVGTVTVNNDANYLYVTYSLDTAAYPGATFQEELQMWAGLDLTTVPSTPGGIPIPGQFCKAAGGACSGEGGLPSAIGQSTYTFTIPFSELSTSGTTDLCDEKLYVFTHASVLYDSDGDGNVDDEDTAWGGCIGVNIPEPGRWYYYMEYLICCKEGPPVVSASCETAFAKGNYVWTTDPKSNPDGLQSLSLTKNRWGWVINLMGEGTTNYDIFAGAGLNDTSKGTKVGSLTVAWYGSTVTVHYILDPGYMLDEVHIYAGDSKPTTIAPGQYGYVQVLGPNEFEHMVDFAVTNTDSDGVWIIAHAVSCSAVEE